MKLLYRGELLNAARTTARDGAEGTRKVKRGFIRYIYRAYKKQGALSSRTNAVIVWWRIFRRERSSSHQCHEGKDGHEIGY